MMMAEYKAKLNSGELCRGCPRWSGVCLPRLRAGTWCSGGKPGRVDLMRVRQIGGKWICKGEAECIRLADVEGA